MFMTLFDPHKVEGSQTRSVRDACMATLSSSTLLLHSCSLSVTLCRMDCAHRVIVASISCSKLAEMPLLRVEVDDTSLPAIPSSTSCRCPTEQLFVRADKMQVDLSVAFAHDGALKYVVSYCRQQRLKSFVHRTTPYENDFDDDRSTDDSWRDGRDLNKSDDTAARRSSE